MTISQAEINKRIEAGVVTMQEVDAGQEVAACGRLRAMATICGGLGSEIAVQVATGICAKRGYNPSRTSEMKTVAMFADKYQSVEDYAKTVFAKVKESPDTYGSHRLERIVKRAMTVLRKDGKIPTQKALLDEFKQGKEKADGKKSVSLTEADAIVWLRHQVQKIRDKKWAGNIRGLDAVDAAINALVHVQDEPAVVAPAPAVAGIDMEKIRKLQELGIL